MSRWRPPHPDPTTTPTPTAQQQEGAARCCWAKCTMPISTAYGVPTCDNHAMHIWATVDREFQNAAAQDEAGRTAHHEARARAEAETAVKLDTGAPITRHDLIPGWIYYIRIDDTIKIGYARNVATRMRQYPPTAELLAIEPGTPRLERTRHSLFHAHLAWGREWFRPNPELDAWIARLRDENGDPTTHAYRFTTPEKTPVVGSKRSNRRW